MTFEATRTALATKLEALRTSFPGGPPTLEYDNRVTIDPAKHVKPWLQVELDYRDGYQADLSAKPIHRMLGAIRLTAWVKAGAGRKECDDLLQWFYPALQMTNSIPPLRTRAAIPLAKVTDQQRNLVGYGVAIPFWTDDYPS